jgi:hypothetical protein
MGMYYSNARLKNFIEDKILNLTINAKLEPKLNKHVIVISFDLLPVQFY